MSCIVLTAPLTTEKLLALNEAMPLAAVEASSMVIDVPAPVALFSVSDPLSPFNELTPEPTPPGQAWKLGAPAVDMRQSPAVPVLTAESAPVP